MSDNTSFREGLKVYRDLIASSGKYVTIPTKALSTLLDTIELSHTIIHEANQVIDELKENTR